MSQFTGSEVDVRCLSIFLFCLLVFGQLIDNFTETGKTLINIAQLFKSLAVRLGVFNPLAAG